LFQKDVAGLLVATKDSVNNWEMGHVEPEFRFYPAIHEFLGYDPGPAAESLGEAVRQERLRRGWSIERLARVAGVDPATVSRMEQDRSGMARAPLSRIETALGVTRWKASP
jgi:DNA-binding XRE family transcriptional regulator